MLDKNKFIEKSNFSYFIFISSFLLFFFHVANIPKVCFDEFHYVPAAKQWLAMAPTTNIEHPPLGKYIIAIGIKLFGDNPIGYRICSTIAGSFSILLCYLISTLLFEELLLSAIIGIFTLFNFWFFVQSRVGMLDIFLVTFYLSGIYYYLKFKYENANQLDFYLSAVFWGLAVAIKWSAVFIYAPFILFITISNFKEKINYLKFGFVSIVIYFFTYFPYMFVSTSAKLSFFEIFYDMPIKMLKLQESVPGNHPYASSWYTWPLMIRPIWYEFIIEPGSRFFRGVILLGNPIQMFCGVISILLLIIKINKIDKMKKLFLMMFLSSWLIWAIAPRKLSFFYYFFPSAIFYSFLIPMSLKEYFTAKRVIQIMLVLTILSIGFFIFFYPILSGAEALENSRSKWHWLHSWI